MRVLDLFCGAGGAAYGYIQAGFTEIVGVDIAPQPNYPFPHARRDVLEVHSWELQRFDLIHASPPCQAHTTMNNRWGSESPDLIGATRELLLASGKPFVIENVPGARSLLHNPVELTGEMFGLGVYRPRLFELGGWMCLVPARPPRQLEPAAVYGKQDGRRLWTRTDGSELRVSNLEEASVAMGIDWMTWDEIREAIPPAYCRYLGEQFLAQVRA
jgi:DNA (cytosine-5)-methyltransferase 1